MPSSSVSSETPRHAVASFDHLVTQCRSTVMSAAGNARNCAQSQARLSPDSLTMRNSQVSRFTRGVGPAERTGKPRSRYCPGGNGGPGSRRRPKNPGDTMPAMTTSARTDNPCEGCYLQATHAEEGHMLGLPDHITACLFDLDGVLTDTASVHNKAWKETFDAFLKHRADQTGTPFVPFDSDKDYSDYVDGKPRADGVRDFLKSRCIELPVGTPADSPDAATVNGLGNRKNVALLRHLTDDGVRVFEGSRQYLQAA